MSDLVLMAVPSSSVPIGTIVVYVNALNEVFLTKTRSSPAFPARSSFDWIDRSFLEVLIEGMERPVPLSYLRILPKV